jgi:hypothetical protein
MIVLWFLMNPIILKGLVGFYGKVSKSFFLSSLFCKVCRDEGSSVLRSDDVLFVLKILSQFIFETTQNYIRQCIATARTQLLNLHYTVPLTGTFLELLFNKLHTNFKKDGHSESLALSFASVCSIWASLQGIVQYITESVKNFSRTFPYQTGMISLFSDYIFDNDVDYPLTIHVGFI